MEQARWIRAEAGKFDSPSELDRLRARVAELEGALETLTEQAERAGWQGMSVHQARSILNNKRP